MNAYILYGIPGFNGLVTLVLLGAAMRLPYVVGRNILRFSHSLAFCYRAVPVRHAPAREYQPDHVAACHLYD